VTDSRFVVQTKRLLQGRPRPLPLAPRQQRQAEIGKREGDAMAIAEIPPQRQTLFVEGDGLFGGAPALRDLPGDIERPGTRHLVAKLKPLGDGFGQQCIRTLIIVE
jgi:hypothetical protein